MLFEKQKSILLVLMLSLRYLKTSNSKVPSGSNLAIIDSFGSFVEHEIIIVDRIVRIIVICLFMCLFNMACNVFNKRQCGFVRNWLKLLNMFLSTENMKRGMSKAALRLFYVGLSYLIILKGMLYKLYLGKNIRSPS